MNTNTKTPAVLHGECIIYKSTIPTDAVVENHDNKSFTIVAESEVTGNHHVIDIKPGVQFLNSGTRRFMKNSVPTDIRCVIAERHSNITIPAGEWEVGIQQEFDYFAMAKKNVAD
jgi:hypothetical protein